jgi:hypothetical protein
MAHSTANGVERDAWSGRSLSGFQRVAEIAPFWVERQKEQTP